MFIGDADKADVALKGSAIALTLTGGLSPFGSLLANGSIFTPLDILIRTTRSSPRLSYSTIAKFGSSKRSIDSARIYPHVLLYHPATESFDSFDEVEARIEVLTEAGYLRTRSSTDGAGEPPIEYETVPDWDRHLEAEGLEPLAP